MGEDEKRRMEFILSAISEYKTSPLYRTAVDAEMYYEGENPTINRYEKVIYDYMGKAHVDMWTANHKIASSFFEFAVDQQNGYLLGNGVSFGKPETKNKLGTKKYPFDRQIQLMGQYALIGGVSYGFWNHDHIEVFTAKEFIPLYDDEDGAIKAGIRFWQIADDKPLRATLYELNGYAEYIKRKGEDMTVLEPKRPYNLKVKTYGISGTEIYDGYNYPTFPIVPLKNNQKCKSLICGKRNTIDALDLARSGMANNVDEGSLIYWVLKNSGGMDDLDTQKFLDRIKTLHVANLDNDGDVTPHTIEAPFEGTQATIDMLLKALYTDFQCFDASAVSAGNQTATAINATYVPMDLKTDKFERQVTEFINGIQELAGTDDEPTYTRNKLINKQEEVQTLMLGAQYLTDDYITRKLLTTFGDIDMAEQILNEKAAEDIGRFGDDKTSDKEIIRGD
ncbi:MAG: phage portal protein [Clostridium sp.]|nr:phage portal protein [Clostridium sp.]MCM1547929.1 phage portal protein [Ruminococcus sp.]